MDTQTRDWIDPMMGMFSPRTPAEITSTTELAQAIQRACKATAEAIHTSLTDTGDLHPCVIREGEDGDLGIDPWKLHDHVLAIAADDLAEAGYPADALSKHGAYDTEGRNEIVNLVHGIIYDLQNAPAPTHPTGNVHMNIYEAYRPGSGMAELGWAGFIEDETGHENIGWHPTREAAIQAAADLMTKEVTS